MPLLERPSMQTQSGCSKRRRWHISLSTWFKQYLYIPLGGNRISPRRTYVNLFVVFLLTGLWHGASWSFVVWGLWNGVFIIFEKMSGWSRDTENIFVGVIKHIYTIFVFVLGWVIFRSDDLSYAVVYIKNMFCLERIHDISYALPYYIDRFEIIIFAAALICSIPVFRGILEVKNKFLRCFVNLWLIVLFILSAASVASSTYNPFIYFRF